jgi:hypothetical protein
MPVSPEKPIAIPRINPIICLTTNKISKMSYLGVSSDTGEKACFQRLVLLDMNI